MDSVSFLLTSTLNQIAQHVKQVAYADDLTGAGKIRLLKIWWDLVAEIGPRIGYYPKLSKSWLIVKLQYAEYAKKIFSLTSIKITVKGKKHLGAVIGSIDYRNEYLTKKVAA